MVVSYWPLAKTGGQDNMPETGFRALLVKKEGKGQSLNEVTLEGPDWPLEAIAPNPTRDRDHTRVVLVSDVVAVYERTILIETN